MTAPHVCRLGDRCAYRDLPPALARKRHRRAAMLGSLAVLVMAAFWWALFTVVLLVIP